MGLELEVHYPTALPLAAAKYLIAGITGGTIGANLALDVEAAWNVAGYALSQTVGHPDHLIGDVQMDDAIAVQHLTAAVAQAESDPSTTVNALSLPLPWKSLAA